VDTANTTKLVLYCQTNIGYEKRICLWKVWKALFL